MSSITSGDVQTVVNLLGTAAEAATDPSAATGTVFSKLRGTGTDLDTLNALVQSTSTETGKTNTATINTIIQIIAATAGAVRRITIVGSLYNPTATATAVATFTLYQGGAGSEVAIGTAHWEQNTTLNNFISFTLIVTRNLAAGTRLSYKFETNSGSPTDLYFGYVIDEA